MALLNKENIRQVAKTYVGDNLGSLGKLAGGLISKKAPKIPGLDYQLLGEYGGEQLGNLFRRGGMVRRRVARRRKSRK